MKQEIPFNTIKMIIHSDPDDYIHDSSIVSIVPYLLNLIYRCLLRVALNFVRSLLKYAQKIWKKKKKPVNLVKYYLEDKSRISCRPRLN